MAPNKKQNGYAILVGTLAMFVFLLGAFLMYVSRPQVYVVNSPSHADNSERHDLHKADGNLHNYPRLQPTACERPEIPFKQIGLLVSKPNENDPPVILPLFGRKILHRRDRYEYYTATDKDHLWKVPVQFEHRDCHGDVGCEEIYDGMDVVVPDYANKTFKARIYNSTVM